MTEFMKFAIEEAQKSGCDIPIGAVIVKNGVILSVAHNLREKENDVTAHAEIIAIREASKILENWRLDNCDLYVTLEPCPMCGWAILQSRIRNLYFGSYDKKYGAFSSPINLLKYSEFKTKIFGGIQEDKCDEILKNFFKNIR